LPTGKLLPFVIETPNSEPAAITAYSGASSQKPLDNQDLCLMLHVSPRTLQRYRSEGLLPFSKRGQKIYYKTSDVREFVYRNGDHWDKKALEDAVAKKD
jgi:hypothetical protein